MSPAPEPFHKPGQAAQLFQPQAKWGILMNHLHFYGFKPSPSPGDSEISRGTPVLHQQSKCQTTASFEGRAAPNPSGIRHLGGFSKAADRGGTIHTSAIQVSSATPPELSPPHPHSASPAAPCVTGSQLQTESQTLIQQLTLEVLSFARIFQILFLTNEIS